MKGHSKQKPPRASDHQIQARRKDDVVQESNRAHQSYYERTGLVSQFASSTVSSRVRRKIAEYAKADSLQMDEKRARLRALYDEDSAHWRDLLLQKQPNTDVDRMRRRVAELKERRERERVRFVEEKLDHHRRHVYFIVTWPPKTKLVCVLRINCDELRQIQSRATTIAVTQSRDDQVRDKQAAHLHAMDMNAKQDLEYENTRLVKIERAEQDARTRHAANMDQAQAHQAQIQHLKETRARLRAEEQAYAEVIKQHVQLKDLEQAFRQAQRLDTAKQAYAEMHTLTVQQKALKAREAQARLQQDQDWIAQLVALDAADKATAQAIKQEVRQDLLDFQTHVRAQKDAADRHVKEIDAMYAAVNERKWRIQALNWDAELAARRKLLAHVLDVRHQQLEAKANEVKASISEQLAEKRDLELVLDKVRLENHAAQEHDRALKSLYRDALVDQINDNRRRKADAADQERTLWEKVKADNRSYESWIQNEKSRLLSGT